jgi:hypothetical protein
MGNEIVIEIRTAIEDREGDEGEKGMEPKPRDHGDKPGAADIARILLIVNIIIILNALASEIQLDFIDIRQLRLLRPGAFVRLVELNKVHDSRLF